jgi:hypothetical protein
MNLNDIKNFCEEKGYEPELVTPFEIPEDIVKEIKKIIVIGDIHGDYKLFKKILLKAKIVKEEKNKLVWIANEHYKGPVFIVQLGDQVDRCRPLNNTDMSCENPKITKDDEASDIKILRTSYDLDKQAYKSDGVSRFISLLGNHELMNVQGDMRFVSYKGRTVFEDYGEDFTEENYDSALEARKEAFKPGNSMAIFLACTRVSCLVIGKYLFVHGGIVNEMIKNNYIKNRNELQVIELFLKNWLLGKYTKEDIKEKKHNYIGSSSFFWNRVLGHIKPDTDYEEDVCQDNLSLVLEVLKVGYLFIGHTPQAYIHGIGINGTCKKDKNYVVYRADCGSSKAFTEITQGMHNLEDATKAQYCIIDPELDIIKIED